MSASQLLIIAALACLVGQLKRGRPLALLAVSAFLIYWLQPFQAPVTLAFWLPTGTLVIAVLAWLVTSPAEVRGWQQNRPAAIVLLAVMVLADLNRYFRIEEILTTATPRPHWLGVLVVALAILAFIITRWKEYPPGLFVLAAAGLVMLFALVKTPWALDTLSETVSALRGKEWRGPVSLSWLGFSYVSFRLLHTILDRKAGRLPPVPLAQYLNYVIFFPSFTAGPIDRLERFLRDLEQPVPLDAAGWVEAGRRFFLGSFKKFVIADALSWIALNEAFARQIGSPAWMWLLLYCYSLRIYFDFSGYTDIAIGLGRVLGVRLPENFASPYLKPNLTQFWSAWHITLTQWFRTYFFNPLVRALRSSSEPWPVPVIILIAQISTMLLIGLWHGVTAGFLLWGLWHGTGLFVQNRWSQYMREHLPAWGRTPGGQALLHYSGILLTFNFVSLGWLFFALPTPASVWQAVGVLFGVA